jgi:cell division protein FtsL
MKTLRINLDKSLKKQIQSVAKIAASSNEVRYYLGSVQIERTEKGLVFTATNGNIMADVVANKFEATNFEIGEKIHVHNSGLLKFESKTELLIEAVDKKATFKKIYKEAKKLDLQEIHF